MEVSKKVRAPLQGVLKTNPKPLNPKLCSYYILGLSLFWGGGGVLSILFIYELYSKPIKKAIQGII